MIIIVKTITAVINVDTIVELSSVKTVTTVITPIAIMNVTAIVEVTSVKTVMTVMTTTTS